MSLLQQYALRTIANVAGKAANTLSDMFAVQTLVDRLLEVMKNCRADNCKGFAAITLSRLIRLYPDLLAYLDTKYGPACLLPGGCYGTCH